MQNLQNAVDKIGVANVEICPPVSRSEIIELYKEADILFLHLNDIPAFRRVIPSKLFEYAATGKPVLAGVGGYCADFIVSEISNAEVFAPCDVDGAENAIKRLQMESGRRSQFIEKYSRKSIMEKLARLVHKTVSEPRR